MDKHNSYKTAIARKAMSAPMRKLFTEGLIKGRVLDYGCGRGYDVDKLHSVHGMDAYGYDPHYAPNLPTGLFDTVTCIYVLNTIPYPLERCEIVHAAMNCLKVGGVLYVAVRTDTKALTGWKKNGTWQGDVRDTLHAMGMGLLHKGAGYEIFFSVKEPPMNVPMCWKCCDKIIETVADGSRAILIGCKANPDIGNYADAQLKCPLLKEKVEPKA